MILVLRAFSRKGTRETENNKQGALGTGYTAHGVSVVLIVVVRPRVDVRTVEVQIVRVVAIVRRSGPIVPVRAAIVGRAGVPVAGIN